MDKKANEGADAPFYLLFHLLLPLMFILFMLVIYSYSEEGSSIPKGLEKDLISRRFYRSDVCFAYSDRAKVYPGVVDWEKFSDQRKEEIMEQCCIYRKDGKKTLAFKLNLRVGDEQRSVQTENWGENIGIQEAETKEMLVYKEDRLQKGELDIEVWYDQAE